MTGVIISVWASTIFIQLVLIRGELKRIADALEKREESEDKA